MTDETATAAPGAPALSPAQGASGGSSGLSACYRLAAGAPLVYGGLVAAAVLAIAAYGAGQAVLWIAALLSLVIAFHNWPLVRQLATALSVGDYGFYIDGLGLLPWSGIKSAKLTERKLGKTALPELVLEVDAGTLASTLSAPQASLVRRLQYRPWRAVAGHLLRVDLLPVGVDPQALLAAIAPRLAAVAP